MYYLLHVMVGSEIVPQRLMNLEMRLVESDWIMGVLQLIYEMLGGGAL